MTSILKIWKRIFGKYKTNHWTYPGKSRIEGNKDKAQEPNKNKITQMQAQPMGIRNKARIFASSYPACYNKGSTLSKFLKSR